MKRTVLTKKKKAKSLARKSKSEMYLVNLKYLGPEPKFKSKTLSQSDCIGAFNWYNTMCDMTDAREYTEEFLTNARLANLAKDSKIIPDAYFPKTSSWVFRLVQQGYMVESDMIKRCIQRIVDEVTKVKQNKSDAFKSKPADQEAKKKIEKSSLIADLEDILDMHTRGEIKEYKLYNRLTVDRISLVDAKEAMAYYQPIVDEMVSALMPKADRQLVEGYTSQGKAKLSDRIVFIKTLLDDLDRYTGNKKVVRKPRKAKVITTEKKLKNFKYLASSAEYKAVSVDPSKVIGAQECYMFNTHNKALMYYVAQEGMKLDIQGNKVINYDEKLSKLKRVGKQADVALQNIVKAAKNLVKKQYDKIDYAEYAVNGRSNDTMLIVRIL